MAFRLLEEAKRVLDVLKLELQVIVSHVTGVLRAKLGFTGRVARGLNPRAIISSPAL